MDAHKRATQKALHYLCAVIVTWRSSPIRQEATGLEPVQCGFESHGRYGVWGEEPAMHGRAIRHPFRGGGMKEWSPHGSEGAGPS